jgi:hypothetical protein
MMAYNRVVVARSTTHDGAHPARSRQWYDDYGEGLLARSSLKWSRGDMDPYRGLLGVGEAA